MINNNVLVQATFTDILIFLLMVVLSSQKTTQTQSQQPVIEIEAAKNDKKKASQDKDGDEIPRLLVSISAQGIYTVDGLTVSINQLKSKALKKGASTVRLKIEKSTPYDVIQAISYPLNKAGFILELM